MPQYLFQTKDGIECRREMSQAEFDARVKNGKLRIRSHLTGKRSTLTFIGEPIVPKLSPNAGWPCKLDCCGIDPDQIPEAIAEDRRVGAPNIGYDPNTGERIFDTALQRKKWSEAHHYYVVTKKGGGHSDPVRLDAREREARAMAGRSVRQCDD